MTAVQGHHWLLDFSDCGLDSFYLENAEALRMHCVALCKKAGMQVVADVFHQFQPKGATGVVVLAESHMSVHTWPEVKFAAVDVYVCDYHHDNVLRGEKLARSLAAWFKPLQATMRDMPRVSVPKLSEEVFNHG